MSPSAQALLLGLVASRPRLVSDSVLRGLPRMESESGPFISTIKTFKCLLEGVYHFLVRGCRGATWME